MKSLVFFGLIYFVLLPLIAIGCDTNTTLIGPPTTTPETKTIDITLEEFTADSNVTRNIEFNRGGFLVVNLGSNPSTGYEWGEAVISTPDIIKQASHGFLSPDNKDIVGAAGTDTWTFNAMNAGTAKITFSYGRPWEGGEKDVYTLTINVTVKP